MSATDIQRRKEELLARRAKLSATQQARLEKRLESEKEAVSTDERSAALIPLHNGRSLRRPLFLIHPVNGDVSCYIDLARRLDPDQPCYGVQAASPSNTPASDVSLEVLASDYIQLIKARQSDGPYLLGGWSFGGVVAFEMARQLQAQDQTVGELFLIDSQVAAPEQTISASASSEAAEIIGFALALGLPLKFDAFAHLPLEDQFAQAVEYLGTLNRDQQLAYVLNQAHQAHVVSHDFDMAQARQAFHAFKAHMRALRNYRPRPYTGSITLFKAGEHFSEQLVSLNSEWAAVAQSGLQVHSVPGNHYTLLHEPNVAGLAAQLNAQLQLAAVR